MKSFDAWPNIARAVGEIIRAALHTGRVADVPVDVWQEHQAFGGTELRQFKRLVTHRPDRGWIVIDYPDDPLGEEIIYAGGDLFAAAFTAVTGEVPDETKRATPRRLYDAMQVRVEV